MMFLVVENDVSPLLQLKIRGMIETLVVDSHAQHGPHAEGTQRQQFHTH